MCSPREGKAARDHPLCPLGSAWLEWTVCCAVCVCAPGTDRTLFLSHLHVRKASGIKRGDPLAAC